MRVTALSPDGGAIDVEVEADAPVARLRRGLARVTGEPAWLSAPLTADGVPLQETHPAGIAPLRPGALLRPGPGPLPDAVRAARSPWHLAVVAGPDTGAVLVPRGAATLGPAGELAVRDDEPWLVSVRPERRDGRRDTAARARGPRRPATLRRGERRPVAGVRVRRAAGRAVLVPARGRTRRVPRWHWAVWPVGAALRAGSTTLVLRRPSPATTRRRLPAALGRWRRYLPAVAGAITSVALATTTHQPVLLLGALTALVLVGPRPEPSAHHEPSPGTGRRALAGDLVGGDPPGPGAAPDAAPTSGAAEPADLAAVRVALATDPAGPLPPGRAWDGDVAVVGPRPAVLAAARGLVLAALAEGPAMALELRTDRPADWSWLVWTGAVVLPAAPGAGGPLSATGGSGTGAPLAAAARAPTGGARLTVLDGPDARTAAPAGTRVLRVGDRPPWCARVLEVDGHAARLVDGEATTTVPFRGVSAAVAQAFVRALAARASVDEGGCPRAVALGDLPGVPPADARAIARRWRRPTTAVALGTGTEGSPVVVDLVRDGPHALVAGTTGSGKSELLATIVLGLALAQPPDRLALLLVDFKGATGLPPALARLPHVVGHLSDLDATGARRTLRGLSAELRRRERVLAARGAQDLAQLDPAGDGTPPRLVVVVDEFRALADDLPDLLPTWARLAAQGRSLGVHLLLATQRPAGAVTGDLRANVALRVVLRVVDAADSTDLVGVPDAARFDRPGRALLRRGSARPETLQVARAETRRPHPAVRRAAAWPPWGPDGWTPEGPPPAEAAADGPDAWVTAIRQAAASRTPAAGPWLPPLPSRVLVGDVPPGPGLPLALADLPDELSRGPVRWDADAGHLLVLGGPGSGRSTTLATIARAALGQGRAVHAVGVPPALLPPGVASCLEADDATRVARLVRLLAGSGGGGGRRPLLLVDGIGTVTDALAALARGAPLECLERLWGAAGGPVAVAAAGAAGPGTQRLAPFFADRLVLGSPDPSADLLVGIPPNLTGRRPEPGRAVHLGHGHAALCQVALPAPSEPPPAGPAPVAATTPADDRPTLRVRPLPTRVAGPLPPPAAPATPLGPLVVLGLGGDDAAPVPVDLGGPLLVVGPRGSGRTAALELLAAGATAAGLRVVHTLAPRETGTLLVVDDLDELDATDPALSDALAARLAARAPLPLVAATTTAHAVAAFRGPAPALVRARRLLVLDTAEPGAADLLGPEGPWLVDPRRQPPGRGALRLGRDVVPVQVATLG